MQSSEDAVVLAAQDVNMGRRVMGIFSNISRNCQLLTLLVLGKVRTSERTFRQPALA